MVNALEPKVSVREQVIVRESNEIECVALRQKESLSLRNLHLPMLLSDNNKVTHKMWQRQKNTEVNSLNFSWIVFIDELEQSKMWENSKDDEFRSNGAKGPPSPPPPPLPVTPFMYPRDVDRLSLAPIKMNTIGRLATLIPPCRRVDERRSMPPWERASMGFVLREVGHDFE